MLDWIDTLSEDQGSQQEILSFTDYMNKFENDVYRQTRPTFRYLSDMIKYFGTNEDGSYKIFDMVHADSPAVYGQGNFQDNLLRFLSTFEEEGFNNKFILLVGPNGSSKSSLVRKLMKGAELYSETEEGSMYSFSWIFPIDSFVKGTLGLRADPSQTDLNTFAYLKDKEVSAILGSELKDHPFLLIPREHRQKILEEQFSDRPDYLDSIRKSYFFEGDLSKKNRMIYDALLKNYQGKHVEVLKHIRVERFNISRRYSSAAVTIEPQLHVDAKIQQITMDKRLASLPPSLQSLSLFSMQGEVVLANRGILEFSDLLKRPIDAYKYLLMTMETRNINLQGILTELDIFFIGTSNEIHLAAFKQHPDFNSFKGRFNFIRVPYLLDYQSEEKIYEAQVAGLADRCKFEPHSLHALCLFSVMTRLRSPQTKNYEDKKLASIIQTFNSLEKALFLTNGELPERLDVESKQVLEAGASLVKSEFINENLYEGKFGISPRDVKKMVYHLAEDNDAITFVEVLDYLLELITRKNEYDFLNMTPQGDFHHPARFIALIKDHLLDGFDKELRESLGMVDDRSYEDYIRKYIENITAEIKNEKIKNEVTGRFEDPNDYFIKEFEKNIKLKEKSDQFRGHLLSKLGAYSIDNPGKELNYTNIFSDVARRLKESFYSEQKKMIEVISKKLVFYEAELNDSDKSPGNALNKESREQIKAVVENLQKKFQYSQNGALRILKYTLNERY